MSARFRIVHFTPDLFSGARVPIAALVEGDDRRVQVAVASFIPGPHCVGGRASWVTLQWTLEDLTLSKNFEQLPSSIGPFVQMEEARVVPATVSNPVEWLQLHVLPRRPLLPEDQAEEPPPAPKRQVQGMAFFTTWKVEALVKPNFSGSHLGLPHDTAFQISHWVPGKSELLLMEPVIGARDDFREEIGRVSTSFLAWRQLLDNRKELHLNDPIPHFIAYVINGRRGEASTVRSVLKEASADVIDVEIPAERDRFIHQIRVVGESRERMKHKDQGEFLL